MIKQPDDMINRLRTYKNGVHGAFFLEVADFLGGYDLLTQSFEANADETIALRARFEELWRVKTDLENDLARIKKERGKAIFAAIGLFTMLKEADEYLDTNNLTNIMSGSILHEKFKTRLAEVKDLVESV